MAIELLAISIRKNNQISGIKIGDTEIKISQLADDTTCFLKDVFSAQILLDSFNDFEKCSGLKVNFSKTEATWIGRNKFNKEGSLPIKWTDGFKTLGLKFNAFDEMVCSNLDTCIEKMESIIKMWRIRNLSLIGKIVILKSLAISKLIYVISSTHVPRSYVIKIQRDINNFLWNDSTPKVKSEVIQKSPSEGGLKAPNFEVQLLSFRIMWVKRFLSEHDSKWKHVSKAFFSLFDLEDLFMSRCEFEFLNLKAPLFYIEVLSAWKRFKGIFIPLNAFHVRKEFIWFNPFIKVNRTSIFYRSWYTKGIRFINDIVEDKGEFLSHDAINKKYNLNVTFVDMLFIRLAIPRDWKDLLLQQHMSPNSNSFGFVFEHKNKKMPISKLFAKDVYSLFIDRGSVSPISQQRWEESFNIEISDEQWKNIYSLAFKCTIESKLQAFQYKLLHRIVPHNYLLEKYKLSLTNECASCKEIETIEHTCFECIKLKTILERIF